MSVLAAEDLYVVSASIISHIRSSINLRTDITFSLASIAISIGKKIYIRPQIRIRGCVESDLRSLNKRAEQKQRVFCQAAL